MALINLSSSLNSSDFLDIYSNDPALRDAYKIGNKAEQYVDSKYYFGNWNLGYDRNFYNILTRPII